jgi:monoterpene epsilon-lactone hydrolase
MKRIKMSCLLVLAALPFVALGAAEPPAQPPGVPESDTNYIDAQGTAHLTRVVPVPATLSPEAQKWLAGHIDNGQPVSPAENRARAVAWEDHLEKAMQPMYPTKVAAGTIAGVPVKIVTPPSIPPGRRDRVLINVHGGGFVADWGSAAETIPIASLTQTEVVSVLYGLAPEHPFPDAVNQVIAVYRELLKTHRPEDMALYGTSAGAILTGELAVKMKQLGLPLPAALGIFSGYGDFSRYTDSDALFTLYGLSGPTQPPAERGPRDKDYVGATDRRDPVLSPVFADLQGLPPTLFVTSTRDMLLSGTTILHRAFLRAGDDAQLVVFEALPHAFWNEWYLPESQEAHRLMAKFFDEHLGRAN